MRVLQDLLRERWKRDPSGRSQSCYECGCYYKT